MPTAADYAAWSKEIKRWVVVTLLLAATLIAANFWVAGDIDLAHRTRDTLGAEAEAIETAGAGTAAGLAARVAQGTSVRDAWERPVALTGGCEGGRWAFSLVSPGKDGKPGSDDDITYKGPRAVVTCP